MIPIDDEDRLLLIPGPTPVHRAILATLARPTISHTSSELAEIMKAALAGLRVIAGNENGKMFVIAGSGTLAQEVAILNFVSPQDRLLVASNGFFATRLHAIADHHGLNVSLREAAPGSAITPEELAAAIDEAKATVVSFTHVETSTGAMAPLPEYMRVIRDAEAMAIVDGVAAFAGVPEPMEELGIDVLLTGSQKALGVPPGLAIVAVTPKGWEKRTTREEKVPAFYADLARWDPIMDEPSRYFATHAVNLVRALAMGVEIALNEGLEARFARHRRLAERFRCRLSELGFEPFTQREYLSPTLSAVRTPASVAASALRSMLYANGVVAAAGLNDPDDRIVRFGHMGNICEAEIAVALDGIERSLAVSS